MGAQRLSIGASDLPGDRPALIAWSIHAKILRSDHTFRKGAFLADSAVLLGHGRPVPPK
jgi:hypothetical protein